MRLSFPHSHAFHGGRLTLEDDGASGPSCTVEFGDGAIVIGRLESDGDGWVLDMPDYETAKGHTVTSRTWKLVRADDETWRSMRI